MIAEFLEIGKRFVDYVGRIATALETQNEHDRAQLAFNERQFEYYKSSDAEKNRIEDDKAKSMHLMNAAQARFCEAQEELVRQQVLSEQERSKLVAKQIESMKIQDEAAKQQMEAIKRAADRDNPYG